MPDETPVQEPPSPLQRLVNAIRKRLAAKTLDEEAEAGKEAAGAVAEKLPEPVMPSKTLDAIKRRQKMQEEAGRE